MQSYQPRQSEGTPLHQILSNHRQEFEHEFSRSFGVVPEVLQEEFDAFIGCGILRYGFTTVECTNCEHSLRVPFSCKRRGICSSCCAKRAESTAAFLTEKILPRVHYRQWVFTIPVELRLMMARNQQLLDVVHDICVRALHALIRRKRRQKSDEKYHPGSVTFVHRFGSTLNLNIHFHVISPDGAFNSAGEFEPVTIEHDDIESVLARIKRRIAKYLQSNEPEEKDDPLIHLDSENREKSQGDWMQWPRPLLAADGGFSVHAERRIRASDRMALYNLCAYGARGAIAQKHLSYDAEKQVVTYELKRTIRGKDRLEFTPMAFLKKIASLIPPPRHHLTRLNGVFAPNHRLRSLIVPKPKIKQEPVSPRHACNLLYKQFNLNNSLKWAFALLKSFKIDVTTCPKCGGHMRMVEFVTKAEAISKELAKDTENRICGSP